MEYDNNHIIIASRAYSLHIQMYAHWFRPWYLLARLRGAASGEDLRGGVLL